MKCSWCQQEIIRELRIKEILYPYLLTGQRCQSCSKQLLLTKSPSCPTCGKYGEGDQCFECQRWQSFYPEYSFKHKAFFQYNEGFQSWIHQYKYLGDYRLRTTFVPELTHFFIQKKGTIITSVPLSEERFMQRGFNQVDAFLEAAGINVHPLLRKVVDSQPQTEKNRLERLGTQQPFAPGAAIERIKDQSVILVDDVYTTGRTLFHAAELLLSYEPLKLRTLTLAR